MGHGTPNFSVNCFVNFYFFVEIGVEILIDMPKREGGPWHLCPEIRFAAFSQCPFFVKARKCLFGTVKATTFILAYGVSLNESSGSYFRVNWHRRSTFKKYTFKKMYCTFKKNSCTVAVLIF